MKTVASLKTSLMHLGCIIEIYIYIYIYIYTHNFQANSLQVTLFQNKPELICLHPTRWFQVSNINNSN